MSLIAELRNTEAQFAAIQAKLEELRNNPELQALKEFEKEIREVLAKHGKSLVDVNVLLDPNYKPPKAKVAPGEGKDKPSVSPTGKKTPFRRYTNPHNGEVVDHYRGAHPTLSQWKKQWGDEVVKGWSERIIP